MDLWFLPDWYQLRERIFLYVLILYVAQYRVGRKWTDKSFLIFNACILAVVVYFALTGAGLLPLGEPLGYWTETAPVEWGLFINLSSLLLWRRLKNTTLATTIAYTSAHAGGYLYEIPRFIEKEMGAIGIRALLRISGNNLFLISSQILAIPILAYLLRKEVDYRPGALTWLGATLYMMTPFFTNEAIWAPMVPSTILYHYFRWVARIPCILMLLAIWMDVKIHENSGLNVA